MFKKPFEVKIDAPFEMTHHIDLSSDLLPQAEKLVKKIEESTVKVIIVSAVAVTASKILTHIAQTKI